jgi:anti-anti-sigma factor
MNDFHARLDRSDGEDVITIEGELDAATAPLLTTFEAALDSDRATAVVVDTEELEFVDVAGVSSLIRLRRWAVDRRRDFRVRNPSRVLLRVLHLTHADHLLPVETPPEA